jgi:hypothetical protein
VQGPGGGHSGAGVERHVRSHLDGDEAVGPAAGVEGRPKQVEGGNDVVDHQVPVRLLDGEPPTHAAAELLVVCIGAFDSPGEDGRVGR